jgi:tetratricopeptide (TPR) repeat protein
MEDYVRYDIDPLSDLPAARREEYDRLRRRAGAAGTGLVRGKLERVLREWREREEWWKKDFPKGDKSKGQRAIAGIFKRLGSNESFVGFSSSSSMPGAASESARRMETAASEADFEPDFRRTFGMGSVPPMPAPAQESAGDGGMSGSVIALRPWTPDEPYSRRMREAKDEDLYRVYLDERPDYENSVAFYLDVAYQLKERGQEALSMRVLSNLAEIDLENRQILRVLGYRLMQAGGKPKTAVLIFKKALSLGEEEPQSYRDLGLAHAAAGEAQAAVDRLYDAVEKNFARGFPGIEVIALTELNAILAAHKGEPLDTRRIDSRFLSNLPLDIRVVLTWDADDTDIDLHVVDPNGDEVFYGQPLSWQGGRVSLDNTTGYGPEEYSLRIAKPGTYRVTVNFYGHRQQILSDATTIQLDFFTRWGTPRQEKQSVTTRLREARDSIVVGEFQVQ